MGCLLCLRLWERNSMLLLLVDADRSLNLLHPPLLITRNTIDVIS
jgi:hypothetical protein